MFIKKIFVRVAWALLCITSLTLASEGFASEAFLSRFPPGKQWRQSESEHFVLVFDASHQSIAAHVLSIAEQTHRDLTSFLRYAPSSKTYVVLTDHNDAFNGYATTMPYNTIVLYLKEPGAGGSFFGIGSEAWLPMVFTHEYTHILHLDMAGRWNKGLRKIFGRTIFPNAGLPNWMIEGLAVYAETKFQNGRGRHPHYDMLMRTEVLEEQFKPLDQMAVHGLRKWPVGHTMYLYGYFFLRYLAETYGEERLVEFGIENSRKFPIFSGNIFKRVFDGKNESALWHEWREALQAHYQQQAGKISAEPLTASQALSESGYFTKSPAFAPDGSAVYYIDAGPHTPQRLVKYTLDDQSLTPLHSGNFSGDYSLSPDGQRLYFCKTEYSQLFSIFSDLYVLEIASGHVTRLTNGMRAFDPTISPDGKTLVFSTSEAGSMTLKRMNLTNGEIATLFTPEAHTQIHHPSFSPDGKRLALQIWTPGGFADIYLFDNEGKQLKRLTYDKASDSSPFWSRDGHYLFFSSDRSGVPNIFAYAFDNETFFQVTNVLSGAFDPERSPDGELLLFEKYSSRGMDIHLAEFDPATWHERSFPREKISAEAVQQEEEGLAAPPNERAYSPSASLRPGFWLPNVGFDEDGVQLGIMTAGRDVLGRHTYALSVGYGLESQRIAYSGVYVNGRFRPIVKLYSSDTSKIFSDIFRDQTGNEEDYWQRERVFGGELALPLYRSHQTKLSLSAGYEYKDMSQVAEEDTLFPEPDQGRLSGVFIGLKFSHLESTRYAVSPETGFATSVTYQRDDELFGSDYNLDTLVGDTGVYLSVPRLNHHVLALKAKGGVSSGDTLSQKVFQLGGSSIPPTLAGIDRRRFFLRGYETHALQGNRFALGSLEYRFPLCFPQRGVGKGIIFWDSLVGVAFSDIGNAWDNGSSPDDFKASVGAELRINLGFQYNVLPLTFRLGFAEGLDDEKGESQFYFTLAFNFWL